MLRNLIKDMHVNITKRQYKIYTLKVDHLNLPANRWLIKPLKV